MTYILISCLMGRMSYLITCVCIGLLGLISYILADTQGSSPANYTHFVMHILIVTKFCLRGPYSQINRMA